MKRKKDNNLPDEIIKALYAHDIEEIEKWKISERNIDVVDRYGRSLVFHAVLANAVDVLSSLLEQRPNLDTRDNKGWSSLHYASDNKFIEAANLLISAGADIEIKDDYGNTPLWRATFSSKGQGDMIKLLLSNNADPNNKNDSGVSPIELAKTIANYDVRQFFL